MFNPKMYSPHIDACIAISKQLYKKHETLLKWNPESESIADLGIGDGRMTKEVILPIIPKNVKEYVGGDISDIMLNTAKVTIQHEKFKTVHLFHHIQEIR